MDPPAPTFLGASSKYLKELLSQDIADVDKTLDNKFASEDSKIHVLGIVGMSSITVAGCTAVPSKGGDLAVAQTMTDLSFTNNFVDDNVVKQLVNQTPKKETTDPDNQKPPAQNDPSGWLAKGSCINFPQKG
jgi:hypothetical protein